MNDIPVQINGIAFKMSFSLKVFRTLGRVWGLDTLPEVMEKVALIEQIETGSLEIYDILFDVLFQCIDSHTENENKISKEQLEDLPVPELVNLAGYMIAGVGEAFSQPDLGERPEKKTKALKK